MRLKDKVAVVTGAAGGIGFAIARRMAESGARVVLADLDAGAVQAKAEALRGTGLAASGVSSCCPSAVSCHLVGARSEVGIGEDLTVPVGQSFRPTSSSPSP